MKFGLYSSIANPPRGEHLDRCIDEVIAEAQLAEASGFDSCFFGEHHQDGDGFLPSPLIVATAVAARTRRLRVGTSVILLPLHHPVRVAEDVITLDLVSRGRVVLGVGIGYQPTDFSAFAVPMEDRVALFEEGVEILRLCWAGERFSYRGKHYTLENLAPDRLILGDPETCVREFQRWQKATGASTFLLRLRHAHSGGPPHEKIMDAIRMFGERVLPYCGTS